MVLKGQLKSEVLFKKKTACWFRSSVSTALQFFLYPVSSFSLSKVSPLQTHLGSFCPGSALMIKPKGCYSFVILGYLNNCTVKLKQFRGKISQLLIWSDISTVLEKYTFGYTL